MPTISQIERWRRLREQGQFRFFLPEALLAMTGAVVVAVVTAVWRGTPLGVVQTLVLAAVGVLASVFSAAREWEAHLCRLDGLDHRGVRCARCGLVDPVHADWCAENEPARLGWFRRRA
jgi:hypothetical protein